jgi:hypothetical protein
MGDLFQLKTVYFPLMKLPQDPTQTDDYEFNLWGLTLGLTSELLRLGGEKGYPGGFFTGSAFYDQVLSPMFNLTKGIGTQSKL